MVLFLGYDVICFGKLQREADEFLSFFWSGVIIEVVHCFSEVVLPLVRVQIGNDVHLSVEVDVKREFFRQIVPDHNVFMSGHTVVDC